MLKPLHRDADIRRQGWSWRGSCQGWHEMDARIEGQLNGVVHTIPTRAGGQQPESHAPSAAAVKRGSADNPQGLPAQLFDANGDGAIESWSYAHGGDSYATFKPAPSGAAGANLRRVSHAPPAAVPTAPSVRRASSHASTAAAIHHAHEAYQRDGAANGPGARTANAPTGASLTSTPATPDVTQTRGAVALASPRS